VLELTLPDDFDLDVANWQTARELPHHSLADGYAATDTHDGSLRMPKPCTACAEPAYRTTPLSASDAAGWSESQ
jgi:hypothetical protein